MFLIIQPDTVFLFLGGVREQEYARQIDVKI